MINIQDKDLLFYDIEVFAHDAFVVFKDIDGKLVRCFKNKFHGIWDVIEGKTLVGFNNYWYDDKILSEMLRGFTPEQLKKTNDKIINEDYKGFIDSRLRTLDVFQQISVSRSGLKKIEGNMGKMILESSVSFDIDRPLSDSEYQEVFEYCCYDVDMVIEIWKLRKKSYFEPKLTLLKRYGNPRAAKWNTTTISANMLINKPLPKWSGHRVPEDMMELVPPDVKDMWNSINAIGGEPSKKSITVNEFGNSIQFGFGGLHGVPKNKKRFENVILSDVGSMYPSIIHNLNVLGGATSLYESIRVERLEVKHKDKTLSDALKLILNSVYGLLKNQYSTLYNPRASATVCIYGQIILYELCRRLSQTCEISNINTDGVAYTSDNEEYLAICKEWEEEFQFGLEHEYYDLWIQRDVNNYIAVEKGTGKIKTKGGDVGRYEYDKPFDNNSCRIIDIAIVDYLVKGVDVITTLRNNLDKPYLYQYILQAGSTFEGTFDDTGKQYQKINRVFATKCSGVLLQKKKICPKTGVVGYNRFPDSPDNMYIWNDECDKLTNFKDIIDLNWYYHLINKKLEGWI